MNEQSVGVLCGQTNLHCLAARGRGHEGYLDPNRLHTKACSGSWLVSTMNRSNLLRSLLYTELRLSGTKRVRCLLTWERKSSHLRLKA